MSPEQIGRFARDFAAVSEGAEGGIGVAVSGGPDSLALLLLADAAFPGRVQAATVDHRLRPESAAEAASVAALCRARDVPHETLTATVTRAGEGLQAAAREARYGALAEWMRAHGIALLLTAHHADDQAETLLMRLNRGSGAAGLAGIRRRAPFPAAGPDAALLRPLLAWRRSELAALVREAGIDAIDDPSNGDEAYDRVRLRRQLTAADWLDAAALARSASALAQAEEGLAFATDRLVEERVRRSGDVVEIDPSGLPRELRRRLAARAFERAGTAPRGEQLTALLEDLAAGRTVTLAGLLCRGGPSWRFEPAPPRRTG